MSRGWLDGFDFGVEVVLHGRSQALQTYSK